MGEGGGELLGVAMTRLSWLDVELMSELLRMSTESFEEILVLVLVFDGDCEMGVGSSTLGDWGICGNG